MNRLKPFAGVLLATAVLTVLAGCSGEPPAAVNAYLSGTLTVNADVDSLADFSGFEVLVASNATGDIDTLGFAVTGADGTFSTRIGAPDKGIYPLVISRGGARLTVEELVVADGDSTRVTARFPLEGRPVRIVSKENAAWSAYKNTKAQYNRSVLALTQSNPGYSEQEMGQIIRQTAGIMWGLEGTFPETMGASVAKAESIVMLEGWDDSLAVARAREVAADHASKVQIVRAVRRSVARLEGLEAAVGFVRSYIPGSKPEDAAALLSEVVLARMDSLQEAEAVSAARELQASYKDTQWSRWAEGAIYEIEKLQPGMPAPAFSLVDMDGDVIDNEMLLDQFFMLEFFTPTHPAFQQELGLRQSLLSAVSSDIFQAVSVSLAPDSAYTEALLDGRGLLGRFAIEPEGLEGALAAAYNIRVIPTRVLIDPAGRIVGKFVGPRLEDLDAELAARLRAVAGR